MVVKLNNESTEGGYHPFVFKTVTISCILAVNGNLIHRSYFFSPSNGYATFCFYFLDTKNAAEHQCIAICLNMCAHFSWVDN